MWPLKPISRAIGHDIQQGLPQHNPVGVEDSDLMVKVEGQIDRFGPGQRGDNRANLQPARSMSGANLAAAAARFAAD
jgi:hypothetical protein